MSGILQARALALKTKHKIEYYEYDASMRKTATTKNKQMIKNKTLKRRQRQGDIVEHLHFFNTQQSVNWHKFMYKFEV